MGSQRTWPHSAVRGSIPKSPSPCPAWGISNSHLTAILTNDFGAIGIGSVQDSKGKKAVCLGAQRISTLALLKQAAMNGEFEGQLAMIGGRHDKQARAANKQPSDGAVNIPISMSSPRLAMKFRHLIALSFLVTSATAWATQWVEVYRDSDPKGTVYYIDQDSLTIKKGVVFFLAKAEDRQTQTMMGGAKYDYQIGQYAVYCQNKTMTGLGNAFYLKNGALVGEVPMSEEAVFDHGKVDMTMFTEMGQADTPWAKKIIYACNWMKKQGKGMKGTAK